MQNRYFADAGLTELDCLSKTQLSIRSFVKTLISVEETGGPPKRKATSKYEVPAGFDGAYATYRDELNRRGLKASTQRSNLCTARRFFATCGADSPDKLTVRSIALLAEGLVGCAPQTRSGKLFVVRDMMRLLAARGDCPMEVAQCMPLIRGHKHSTIPSAYTRDEVMLMLEEQPYKASLRPKRDRAIALLAGVLGMRASDIKALRLCDIDWCAKKITFVQKKTQVGQTLPMPEEVWLALADYLKNERPSVENDYVFITAYAPYRAIESSHSFHRAISRIFAKAGIDTTGKRHGMHSLRHSMASGMLADGIPYPTISATLGHSSTNVTKRYLAIDVESLRPIALEVPKCRRR